ncbi:DUF99 family protein [Sessilibacter sp. MAH1]
MHKLEEALQKALHKDKQLRVVGFDDAPFQKTRGSVVNLSGIICSNTRFEGMLWGELEKDGTNATEVLIDLLINSKFYSQLHLVLTDGIAFGGFNIIDLPKLSTALNLPCIAVMRKMPNLTAINDALKNFDDYTSRYELVLKAGEIYQHDAFYFQCAGCSSDTAARALIKLTDTGNVPEALRLAHLIGSAVKTGQSGKRA